MNKQAYFITVDDDPISQFISKKVIRKMEPKATVHDFTAPRKALNFINEANIEVLPSPVILLLDINMPEMNGWDFLKQFHELEEAVKEKFTIFMLSSSIDNRDIRKAEVNPYVEDYLVKPLEAHHLKSIAGV